MNEKELTDIIRGHFNKYPLSKIEDMLKLIYQNEFGCGHMVTDVNDSLDMIRRELKTLSEISQSGDGIEYIGNGLCRLHLHVLKNSSLSAQTLNSFFTLTAEEPMGSAEGYEKKTEIFIRLCEDGQLPFKVSDIITILNESRAAGHPLFRHSGQYRSGYEPSYRVVDKKFCDYLPLFTRIDELMETQQNIVLAIDGSSAAGKSSLAEMLKSVYSCNLFTMDDFFLQPFQRTAQRLEEPGENIDYERFESEIIRGLKTGGPFQYEIFDCDTEELSSPIEVSPKTLSVVEGVYSLHPNYSDSYDIKVFLKIDEAEQLRRLKERSPGLYQRFIDEWIPMENKYFEFFRVADKCDLIFNTGDKGM